MNDYWESGDPYEYFMGRWSLLAGRSFLNWLSAPADKHWLDFGCGTGALSQAILDSQRPARLTALDQSEGFIETAQQRLGERVQCKVGNAMALPFPDDTFDLVVSGLVLNFIPEPVSALREVKRITAAGGTVAAYVWDYSGKMEFLSHFWDAAVELNPSIKSLHEGQRFPNATGAGLHRLFERAGLHNITLASLEIETVFKDFDDYWMPFLGGQGPAPSYVTSLTEDEKTALREHLRSKLPFNGDGTLRFTSKAWATKADV